MKKNVVNLLFSLFTSETTNSIYDYEQIDEFYSTIGYELESENLLRDLKVNGTSDLQEILIDYNNNLDGEMTDKDFSRKWLDENM